MASRYRPRPDALSVTDGERIRGIRRLLLGWYRQNRRDLPWRSSRDPYAIWVSEVMLQQTQVATVLPYYERWMARFPTIATLAAASEDDVLHCWQGLGYYSRARRLLEGARVVVRDHGGSLPRSPSALQGLPGIGAYSAGAIASMAFGGCVPVVDGNVVRVVTRLEALRGDPTRQPLRGMLWRLAATLVPRSHPGDFNQALMELGATLCSPRAPKCAECPLAALCLAHEAGLSEQLPELAARPAPTAATMAAAVVERRGRWLMVQAPREASRWAGMWMFPTTEQNPDEPPTRAAKRVLLEQVGLGAEAHEVVASVQHAVTRFRITLAGVRCELTTSARPRARGVAGLAWVAPGELAALALPAPQRRLADQLGRVSPRKKTT